MAMCDDRPLCVFSRSTPMNFHGSISPPWRGSRKSFQTVAGLSANSRTTLSRREWSRDVDPCSRKQDSREGQGDSGSGDFLNCRRRRPAMFRSERILTPEYSGVVPRSDLGCSGLVHPRFPRSPVASSPSSPSFRSSHPNSHQSERKIAILAKQLGGIQ